MPPTQWEGDSLHHFLYNPYLEIYYFYLRGSLLPASTSISVSYFSHPMRRRRHNFSPRFDQYASNQINTFPVVAGKAYCMIGAPIDRKEVENMASMTGGQAVVETLKAHGVNTVFGIISTHTMHIYDALYDPQDSIRLVGGRHEHALGFMADGYSRATGKPGVFLTSGGPGATASMGSMGEAYRASSQILQITSNA